VDALGKPTELFLTPGQAHDLQGADALLPEISAATGRADKGYDALARGIEPLEQSGKTVVIPPQSNRKTPRCYEKELYKARHLIENFLANLKQVRALATRYDKHAVYFLGAIYLVSSVSWLN